MNKAIEEQVGGSHYINMKRQPIEKTYDTYGYEGVKHSIYTKVDKYLTRDKGTDRADITKAIHCLELQLGFYDLAHDDTFTAEDLEAFIIADSHRRAVERLAAYSQDAQQSAEDVLQ